MYLRNTYSTIADGVFDAPTFLVEGKIFWGDDATEMILNYLDSPSWWHRNCRRIWVFGHIGRSLKIGSGIVSDRVGNWIIKCAELGHFIDASVCFVCRLSFFATSFSVQSLI
tara:strand:+ start:1959 stop:2294 length:336 start_codon:yes stop_codon:yes gene_type:complete